MVVWALLCHSCGLACQQRVLITFLGTGFENEVVWLWQWLVNLHIWVTISCCYGSFTLTLVWIRRDGGLSALVWLVRLFPVEGAKNLPWPWECLLWGWGNLNMTLTAKFVYVAHHFILLQLNPFGLVVDREGSWFEHSCVIVAGLLVSRVC